MCSNASQRDYKANDGISSCYHWINTPPLFPPSPALVLLSRVVGGACGESCLFCCNFEEKLRTSMMVLAKGASRQFGERGEVRLQVYEHLLWPIRLNKN